MEEILKEELRAGEKVIWSAQPEAFETMDLTNKQAIIRKAAITIGIVTALCVVYIAYALSKGIALKPALVIIAMACAIGASLNHMSESKKLRKIKYFITDQRIIYQVDLPKSLEYDKVKDFEFKTDADGHTSILFGETAINSKSHQWRSLALADAYIDEASGLCSRFAMYAIPDAERVKKILNEYISH